MTTTYRGFSTVGRSKQFRLTDFELIKQDLINHFHIRKGEKLMRPDFGTIIWNVMHEPFTQELKDLITDDIKAIITYDPRLAVDNIIVTEYNRGLQIELELRYLRTNQSNKMRLKFDGQNNTLTAS
jgi:phage baseplate assembly protein W